MNENFPQNKAERIAGRVDVTPIFCNYDDVRGQLDYPFRDVVDDLVMHGEVVVVTDEHPEGVELHAGNTEIVPNKDLIRVDRRKGISTFAIDSVISHEIHYEI